MIRVQQLLDEVGWHAIKARLLQIYPDQLANLAGYHQAWQEMVQLDIVEAPTGHRLVFEEWKPNEHFPGDPGGSTVCFLSGADSERYAAEWLDWRDSLGLEVDEGCLSTYSREDLACHFLFELTFCGYSYEAARNEIARMKQGIEESLRDIEEGRYTSYDSVDDMFKAMFPDLDLSSIDQNNVGESSNDK